MTIQKEKTEAIQNKKPQKDKTSAPTQKKKGRGYTKHEAAEGVKIIDNTERKNRGHTKQADTGLRIVD